MVLNVPVQRSATIAFSLERTLWPQLETTAANLANSTTSGFKRVYAESTEVQYQDPKDGNLSYVRLTNINRDFSPGALKLTHNTYDLAISGDGFFQLEDGKLTHNGQFHLNVDGTIVAPSGEALLGDTGGGITIPADSRFVHVSPNGTVSNQNGVIGRIGVFTVDDKNTLQYTKDGYYISEEDPVPSEDATIHQGYIMESNVNPVEEMVKLISIQRRYEQTEKLLKESYSLARDVVNVSSRSAV